MKKKFSMIILILCFLLSINTSYASEEVLNGDMTYE
ncbi:hypothetical protein TICRE_15760 [Tissierella creatinophila DSM 6911]|uniref:Uncharacterized protein n=1 Tax=Tissierella creatinophila DSM 6911 TaxID=1123403 RepID=A0A1U7M5J1_TISCR|nr:hypothetical protein TICRE_15760 [Tissierella creatinophila DSM 6911]